MQKAAREAKTLTTWIRPDNVYEEALEKFVRSVLADGAFKADLDRFIAPLLAPAAVNSLAQTLLKLTAPGVPDIYQGSELWDLSLVDPDNRRPVDFKLRRRLLDELEGITPEACWARSKEGLPKMYVLRKVLAVRRFHPEWFGAAGNYEPIVAAGRKMNHVIAYMRGRQAMTIVPRLPIRLNGEWEDTAIHFPAGKWHNTFTGETVSGAAPLAELLRRFPIAFLLREKGE